MKPSSSRAVFVPASAATRGPVRAFSLVITLIIVSMLAVVAIGFLASMSSERTTADAFGNKARAEQAAQAGVDSAMAILRQAFKDFPDSATVWENHSINKDGTATVDASHPTALYNEGTSLYVRAMSSGTGSLPDPTADNSPNHTVSASDGSDARQLFVLPLISGETYRAVGQIASWTDPKVKKTVDSKAPDFADKYVDINVRRAKGDSQGWLGSPVRSGAVQSLPPKTVRVPWVNVPQAGVASNPPITARYAFWVEDESFRANINYAGLGSGSSGENRLRSDNTGNPLANLSIDPSIVDLFGPFRLLSDASSASTLAQSLVDVRKLYPNQLFSEALGFAHTKGLSQDSADQLRFLTTTTSSGLNLSRHGTQRVNINQLVPRQQTNEPVPPDVAQHQVDSIARTIRLHAPNFGQRFYRAVADAKKPDAVLATKLNEMAVPSIGSTGLTSQYIYKLAANIKDYLDQDSLPTILDAIIDPDTGEYTGKIREGLYLDGGTPPAMVYPEHPAEGIDGKKIFWAQGKEAGPYLEECAVRFDGFVNNTTNRYQLNINYYIEVWNPTSKDVRAEDLGGDLKVHIADQPSWWAGLVTDTRIKDKLLVDQGLSPSEEKKRDFNIVVPRDTVFKAGKATVLTTDKHFAKVSPDLTPMPAITTGEGGSNFIYCSDPGTQTYSGPLPAGRNRIYMYGRQGSSIASDYYTEVSLYSGQRYIDLAPGPLPLYSGTANVPIFIGTGTPANTNPTHTANKLYGGSLRANGGTSSNTPEPSVLGDPRANNEQFDTAQIYQTGTAVNQPRYYNFTAVAYDNGPPNYTPNNKLPGTLGLPNADFLQPQSSSDKFTSWPDYYMFPVNDLTASPPTNPPVMNAGNVPMFIADAPLTSIGQLGDIYDPARWAGTSVNLARGGGRTLKIGQHDDLWDGDYRSASRSWAAWRLVDFFGTKDTMLQPGLININGVARDNGAALRAALTGFKFLDNFPAGQGAPNIEKKSLIAESNAGIPQGLNTIVSQIKRRLAPTARNDPNGQPITTGTVPVDGDASQPDLAPYNTGQGPFFERGEFSELPAFGRTNIASTVPTPTYPGGDLVAGVATNTTFDRGREEIFRRMADLITTRGNVFTVYAMGQALSPTKAVVSSQRLKVTFRLIPKQKRDPAKDTGADFHPGTEIGPDGTIHPTTFPDKLEDLKTKRFARPDHYDIEILSASKGGG